jgi:hypothetical protein
MEQIVPDKLAYAQVIKLMGIPLRQKGESNSRLISKHGFFKRII